MNIDMDPESTVESGHQAGGNAGAAAGLQNENAPPNHSSSSLVVGSLAPALKVATSVPTHLFRSLPRSLVVLYSPSDESFPPGLRDINSKEWNQSKQLKAAFPIK
jgi:hypothetical protein